MPRHRGTFDHSNLSPYELSRGRLESFIRCPACFWLDRARGVPFPSIPGFLLNTNTDTLLKKDFDKHRGAGPLLVMAAAGLDHLRPYEHPDLGKWTNSVQFGASERHFNTVLPDINVLFGGGIDDVWENIDTGELHIVDYKSTAQVSKTPKPLDKTFIAAPEDPKVTDYKAGYRRQMEMYQWIARRKGFRVSDIGYFVYVDGQHVNEDGMLDSSNPYQAWMRFNVAIIPYEGNDDWVEDTIRRAAEVLISNHCPAHSEDCEFERLINMTLAALDANAR